MRAEALRLLSTLKTTTQSLAQAQQQQMAIMQLQQQTQQLFQQEQVCSSPETCRTLCTDFARAEYTRALDDGLREVRSEASVRERKAWKHGCAVHRYVP